MVEGKHLGRFAVMQVPAIVVEKKWQITNLVGTIYDIPTHVHTKERYKTACKPGSLNESSESSIKYTCTGMECKYLLLGYGTGVHMQWGCVEGMQESHKSCLTADLSHCFRTVEMHCRRRTALR